MKEKGYIESMAEFGCLTMKQIGLLLKKMQEREDLRQLNERMNKRLGNAPAGMRKPLHKIKISSR